MMRVYITRVEVNVQMYKNMRLGEKRRLKKLKCKRKLVRRVRRQDYNIIYYDINAHEIYVRKEILWTCLVKFLWQILFKQKLMCLKGKAVGHPLSLI